MNTLIVQRVPAQYPYFAQHRSAVSDDSGLNSTNSGRAAKWLTKPVSTQDVHVVAKLQT